jgi:hypothetical protein
MSEDNSNGKKYTTCVKRSQAMKRRGRVSINPSRHVGEEKENLGEKTGRGKEYSEGKKVTDKLPNLYQNIRHLQCRQDNVTHCIRTATLLKIHTESYLKQKII